MRNAGSAEQFLRHPRVYEGGMQKSRAGNQVSLTTFCSAM